MGNADALTGPADPLSSQAPCGALTLEPWVPRFRAPMTSHAIHELTIALNEIDDALVKLHVAHPQLWKARRDEDRSVAEARARATDLETRRRLMLDALNIEHERATG